MSRCLQSRRPLSAAALLLAVAAAPALAGGEAPADGLSLATDYCGACHRVRADQPQPPDVAGNAGEEGVRAPSFREIAERPGRDADYLRAAIEAPHYPMREQRFIPEELDTIVAYILSLRDSGESW